MTTVILGDGVDAITFLGARPWPVPPEGVWEFADLDGWRGKTDDKVETRERPQAHGAFSASRSLRTARSISMTARFVGASRAATERALDALDALGAEGPITMTVAEDSGATSRVVTIRRSPVLDRRSREIGSVSLDVSARDPRRYTPLVDAQWFETGPVAAASGLTWAAPWSLSWGSGAPTGRITLANTGRAPSAPRFQLAGGFASALVSCAETGARIGFDRPVPAGSVVEIDTATHRAILDGLSDVSRWLRWREWELVPPRTSRTYQLDVTGAAGSPLLRGMVRSAWW